MRRRPLHALIATSVPHTPPLSSFLPPIVQARHRRRRGKEGNEPLWAVWWDKERWSQRVVVFGLVCACTDSQPATTTTATQSRHSSSSHHSPHSSSASTAAAGGDHVDKERCASSQAGAHTSSTAANRQPSATATDSRSAASRVVKKEAQDETSAVTPVSGDDITRSTPTTVHAAADRPLPLAVLQHLPSLSYEPRRLPVIADGRCSVASVLLARGVIADEHATDVGRWVIDAERRCLGQSMADRWTVADWVRRVPIVLRGGNKPIDATEPSGVRHSYEVYRELLTEKPPTRWLDHCVFYLASAEYDIGIFIIFQWGADGGSWHCIHVGRDKARHIVLYMARGHYECLEYGGLREFSSEHEFVVRMSQFADGPQLDYPEEDDEELQALQPGTGAPAAKAAEPTSRDARDTAQEQRGESEREPEQLSVTPRATRQRRAKLATRSSRAQANAKRALDFDEQKDAAQPHTEPDTASVGATAFDRYRRS